MNGKIVLKSFIIQQKNGLKDNFDSYPKRKLLFLALAVFFLLGVFFRVWILFASLEANKVDLVVSQTARNLKSTWGDWLFKTITFFGSGYFISVLFLTLAIYLIKRRRRKAALAVLATLVGSALGSHLLKQLFGRLRPTGCLREWDCFGYPSGHVAISLYFYGMLFFLILCFGNLSKKNLFWIGLFLGLLVSLIALSRIYLEVHFMTDIIGGLLFGGVWLLLVAILIDFFYQR